MAAIAHKKCGLNKAVREPRTNGELLADGEYSRVCVGTSVGRLASHPKLSSRLQWLGPQYWRVGGSNIVLVNCSNNNVFRLENLII